ncbi:carbamoyltransferase [Streptomyces sp. NPDC058683]|uniref:carbamoyltransferase family protein n=1 Tax=Streptomyces sp. NPDC058683 TaxID=3346597 RepID=UPI00365166E1
MTVRVLGLNLSHDSSACLVVDGEIRAALALERTSRVKRGTVPLHAYAGAMAELTRDVLSGEDLTLSDIDYWITTSTESRNEEDEARLAQVLGLLVPPERSVHLPHPGHHLAHASSAFYTSGFEEAAALVIDAYGSLLGSGRERESGFHFAPGTVPETVLQTVRDSARAAGYQRDGEMWLPQELTGVGEIYRVVTLALGFRESGTVYDDAGKTMGLASYGKRLSQENLFIGIGPDGSLSFDRVADSLVELGLAVRVGTELRLVPRPPRAPFTQFHYDLAAQVQAEFEDACLHLVRELLARTGSRSLVAAGGCFLNSTLNPRLLRETDIDRLFVFPAATDDGNAAGAALYAYHNLTGRPSSSGKALQHVYFGPPRLAGRDVAAVAERWNLTVQRHSGPSGIAKAAAQAIARGEIVGWFQDRSEFGPRSLGARSILCHPGLPGMKDRLNARVKFREAFRPFAGSVLSERARDYFDMPAEESPFMLLVCPVRPERQESVSEIVHVDGTCRIQTVNDATPGAFRTLLQAFEAETGLPLVLNTSFNLRGMPIVEHPEEAVDCLYGSRLDRLFIGDVEIAAPDFEGLHPVAVTAEEHWSADRTVSKGPSMAGLPELGLRLLDLADGSRPISEVAKEIGSDVDETVDVALDLRRLGLLRWAEVPEVPRPVYPLAQYLPDGSAD